MTKEELNRRRMMFQINAKRNELLKPEDIGTSTVRHSATNDFLAFRKKVAAGMKKQKEQNAEVFNVTAANLQNYQDMLDNNELIHAGTGEFKPTYYQKVENAFGPGKHRYFYTKEEWDAYQNELAGYRKKADDYVKNRDANNNAGADRAANDSKVANDQKAEKIASNLRAYQAGREAAIKNSNTTVSKEEFERRVAKDKESQKNPVQKMGNSVKTAVKDLVKAEAIKSDTDRWNKYDQDIRDSIVKSDPTYSNIKTQSDFVKAAKEAGGVDKFYDDLEAKIKKAQGDRDNYNKNAEAANNAGADRAKKDSAEANTQKESKVSKEYQEEKEYNTTGKTLAKDLSSAIGDNLKNNEIKGKISDNIGSVAKNTEERQKKILDDAFKEGANADDLASKYGVSTDYIRELVYNVSGKTVPTKKDLEEQKKKKTTNSGSGNTKNSSSNKSSSGYTEFTLGEDGTTKRVKHSSEEDGITTSDAMTPEQEYLEFRKKVEAGLKHFGLNRNLMSVPKNQALADGDSMSHAGMTNKYYAKIDDFWGKGKPRYFYSKEEWDGYQKNAGYAQNAEKKKAIAQKNSNDSNYQKNADYAKNAGSEKAKKDEWNAASKKTGLSYKEGTNKEYDNQYKQDRKELDEAFWQGKGDLKKAQEKMSKYDHNMESGKDFYVNADGEAKLGDNYSFKLSDDHYIGQEPEWTAPGLKDPNEHTWSDEDVKKLAKYNQPIIDHCVEFYEKYVLENDETRNDGRKKFTAWDVEHEIQDYLNRVIPRAYPEYRDEERSKYYPHPVSNNAGYALKQVLWQLIENRIDSEKKAWDRTHKN